MCLGKNIDVAGAEVTGTAGAPGEGRDVGNRLHKAIEGFDLYSEEGAMRRGVSLANLSCQVETRPGKKEQQCRCQHCQERDDDLMG